MVEAGLEGFGELFGGANVVQDAEALLRLVVCGDRARDIESLGVGSPKIEAGLVEIASAFVGVIGCGKFEQAIDVAPLFEKRVTTGDLKACGQVSGIEGEGVLEIVYRPPKRADLKHDAAEESVGFGMRVALFKESGKRAKSILPSMSIKVDQRESIEGVGMIWIESECGECGLSGVL